MPSELAKKFSWVMAEWAIEQITEDIFEEIAEYIPLMKFSKWNRKNIKWRWSCNSLINKASETSKCNKRRNCKTTFEGFAEKNIKLSLS